MTTYQVSSLDFETTGVDAKTAIPVEVALIGATEYIRLINPGIPIPPETSAVHHIVDADVARAQLWPTVKDDLSTILCATPGSPLHVVVAHNAQYEKDILGDFTPVLWLCTYKAALRVWPDAPNHKNETLRYWLGLPNLGRSNSHAAHSAEHDARVTLQIYGKLLEHATIEEMLEWTTVPGKLKKMPMGKHFGQELPTIPGPYLQWCINQSDMREDVVYSAKLELQRRKG
jgi:exodeoxyribonuclease X